MNRKTAQKFSSIRRMMRREDGSVTVEVVLWLPVLLFLLAVTADASLIFGTRAQILRVVQDANRAASIGRLRDEDATIKYIKDNIGVYADKATVTTEFVSGVVSSTVVIPSYKLTATGFFSGFAGFNVTVNTQHRLEA
jgi:Flp pilus assembly protein TadG